MAAKFERLEVPDDIAEDKPSVDGMLARGHLLLSSLS
jgi:hypothetical protein